MFRVYILYSKSLRKYYVGQTQDLDRRIEEHNRGKTSFTAKGVPWEITWTNEYASRSEAMAMEKRIKSRGAGRFLSEQQA
jgi:putative endonuclease